MSVDKTKNKQILLTIPDEILKLVEDFQFENRIKNRNEAIRQIIKNFLKDGHR